MNIKRYLTSAAISAVMMFAALPARAGVPVLDAAALVEAIEQVASWAQQAEQMVDQYNQLIQQFQQLQTMTMKLDGIRNLGTILNDPNIQAALPTEMRDANQLLVNPAAAVTSAANANQILSSFGIVTGSSPLAARSAADAMGRVQKILSSAQNRNSQLQQLAQRVNTTSDAKDSLDMLNRNVLESANINNQTMQTMASLEAAKQAADLKQLAEDQVFFGGVKAGASRPLHSYTY